MKTEIEHCSHFDYHKMTIKPSCPVYGRGGLAESKESMFCVLMRCLKVRSCEHYED